VCALQDAKHRSCPSPEAVSLVRHFFDHGAETAIYRKLINAALRKKQGMRLAPTR
jgi:hypothetical protein